MFRSGFLGLIWSAFSYPLYNQINTTGLNPTIQHHINSYISCVCVTFHLRCQQLQESRCAGFYNNHMSRAHISTLSDCLEIIHITDRWQRKNAIRPEKGQMCVLFSPHSVCPAGLWQTLTRESHTADSRRGGYITRSDRPLVIESLLYMQINTYTYLIPQSVRSASANRLAAPSLRGTPSHSTKSRLFAVLAPKWWNELPIDIRTAESLHIFCRRLKTHLFRLHLG